MKKNKYTKQTTIKVERKVDNVIYYTILGLLIGLPLMQLIRMTIAGSGNLGLYYSFHCGYLLWFCIPVLLVCYLMIIFWTFISFELTNRKKYRPFATSGKLTLCCPLT